jgi:tetratricopeptide (TPR) repeat protein|tara:strand:+ start:128 stop:487 length:360 start_codon:yes stop_codon:yes gene_type:complete
MTGLFSYPKRKLRKLINEGEYEQAIEFGNDLEEKFSDDPDFLFIMASMFYILKDEKNTLHYINRVLEINEYDTEALSLKLRVYQFLKNNKIVIDCCKKILKVDSDNFEVRDILESLEED